jgi:hypothetical protein
MVGLLFAFVVAIADIYFLFKRLMTMDAAEASKNEKKMKTKNKVVERIVIGGVEKEYSTPKSSLDKKKD